MQIKIAFTASGDNQIAPSYGADRRNKLRALFLVSDTDVSLKFKDDNGDLTGAFPAKANVPFSLIYGGNSVDPLDWLAASGALILNLSVDANVSGWAIVAS